MAKQTLPTNFKDDILDSSMGGKRRYNLITNTDGTVSLEDVTTYTQIGSNFGAGQINATNTAVNSSADAGKIIDNKDTLLATTTNGYIAGVKAVKEIIDDVNSNLGGEINFELCLYTSTGVDCLIMQNNGYKTLIAQNTSRDDEDDRRVHVYGDGTKIASIVEGTTQTLNIESYNEIKFDAVGTTNITSHFLNVTLI